MSDALPLNMPVVQQVSKNWWVLVLRGLAAIALGIVAFTRPVAAVHALILMYGVYSLIDGAASIFMGIKARWWSETLLGVVSMLAGGFAIAYPVKVAFIFIMFIAAFAIVRGIMEIFAAIRLRKAINNHWLLAAAGVASVIFGALLFTWPLGGALTLLWMWASMAIVFGILLIAAGFKLKTLPANIDKLADNVRNAVQNA